LATKTLTFPEARSTEMKACEERGEGDHARVLACSRVCARVRS